jgi:outer membrane receptor protein involved in Fe transport
VLTLGVVALAGIDARATRPPVIHAEDRTIYSVRDMPSVTGAAADVLRTLPELEVDIQGNVTMTGNRSVTIHINGRPSPLRGDLLTQFLKNLPADRIERVEVIPNPSVRFENGGDAIVNVVLRKDVRLGLSGSLSASTATRGSNSLSGQLAYQRGKLTVFGGGSGNVSQFSNRAFQLRQNLQAATALEQDQDNQSSNSSGGGDLTAELDVGARETLWASGTVYRGGSDNDGLSRNRLLDAAETELRAYERASRGDGEFHFGEAAIGFRRIVEPQKNELSLELRRGWNGSGSSGRIEETTQARTTPVGPGEDELRTTAYDNDAHELTLKGDYSHPLAGGRLELGLRSHVSTSGEQNTLDVFGPAPLSEPRGNTRYAYESREREHAAYFTLTRRLGRLSVQGGLRAEAANVGITAQGEDVAEIDYFSVFPSANVSAQLGPGRDLRLSYAKRVRRPWAQSLNPFVLRTDPLNIRTGNPDLRPTTTQSLTLDGGLRIHKLALRLSPYFRYTTDEVDYLRTVDSTGVGTTMPQNVATVTSYGTSLNASLRPAPMTMLSGTFGLSHTTRDADNLSAAYSGSWSSQFVMLNASAEPVHGFAVQGSARLTSPRESSQGRYSSTLWTEIGLRKNLLRDKATLNVRIADPLGIYRSTFIARDPTFRGSERSSSSWAARSGSVSFTWRFGKLPNRRSTTAEPSQAPPAGGGTP